MKLSHVVARRGSVRRVVARPGVARRGWLAQANRLGESFFMAWRCMAGFCRSWRGKSWLGMVAYIGRIGRWVLFRGMVRLGREWLRLARLVPARPGSAWCFLGGDVFVRHRLLSHNLLYPCMLDLISYACRAANGVNRHLVS